MRRLFLLLIILSLVVGSYAQDESYFNPDNLNQDSSSAVLDQYLQEQQKLEQLQGFGINIEASALGGVTVEGDTVSISGQTFNFNGATLSGGNVVIKNGELVSAQNVQADSFKYQGANVDGTFSVTENTLTIEEGNLELGSESSSTLKVLANSGTNIDVSKDQGYTGMIQSSGTIALTLKDQSIPVSGKVELVEGKIKDAEKVEVKTPSSNLFSDLPFNAEEKELKVSMAEGKFSEGNVFDTPELCLDASCVLSEQESVQTKVTPTETTYTSEAEVTYTQDKEVDKIWDSPEEVSKQEDASWLLSPGTEFTEWEGTEPDLTITTAEETTYLPPEMPDQSNCPPGMSCVNYADPDQLGMQSLTTDQTNVDLWDPNRFLQTDLNTEEGSTSTLNSHDTSKEGEGILQFQAVDNELEVYPASELPNFFTEDPTGMISERELSSTTEDDQTLQVDASEIKLLDENGETIGKVADPFDAQAVQDAYTESGYFNPETGEYVGGAVTSDIREEQYINRLTGMRERGEISSRTAEYLINMPNLNLDDPSVRNKVEQLDQIGQIDPEQARNLKAVYSQYGQGSNSQKDEAVLDDLISLSAGKTEIGSTLNLPSSLPQEQLPRFLNAMDVLKKNGISDSVTVDLELWQRGVTDKMGDKPFADYFLKSTSLSENQKGIARLQEMQKVVDEESLSPSAQTALKQTLQNVGVHVSSELNYLHDKDTHQRQTLAKSLPIDVAVGVLSQSTGGLGYDLYRSSEELVYQGLVEKAGGANNLVPYLESKGYGLETKKGKGVINMLAAAGQLAKVLPKDPAKRREVYQTAITSIETPADGFETSRTILNNPATREEYNQALLEQYQKIQDPKSPEEEARRDLIQYTVRMNQDKFDQNNPTVKTILETPSEIVLTQEQKLNLPSQQWIDQSPKEDNVPVLSSLVYFTSTEDPNERVIYNGFSSSGEGFKVKERLADGKGYILEKKGILNGQSVTYRTIVTNDASVAASTKANTPLIAEFSRGHSYDADKAWNTPADKQGNMPKFGFVGSCAGSSSVIGKDLTTENPDTAFFATAGVGMGSLNNAYFNAFYRSIDKCKDYVCVENTLKSAGGRGEYADNYAGPAKFNAQAFSSKNYVNKPQYAKTLSEENPPLVVSTASQGTIDGPG